MSGRVIKSGLVDQYCEVKVWTTADGAPKTDLVYNTSGLAIWYQVGNATPVEVVVAGSPAPATMSAGGAHADWGIYHIAQGRYKIGLADAVVSSAANVTVWIVFADCDSQPCEIDVIGYDKTATAVGASVAGDEMDLINAPNATAVTAIQSGLSTHDAAAVVTALGTGSTLTDLATAASIAALNNVSIAQVGTEVAGRLIAYDPPTKAELDAAVAGLATSAQLPTDFDTLVITDGKIGGIAGTINTFDALDTALDSAHGDGSWEDGGGGGGGTVNVLLAVGIVADRSAGVTLKPIVGETISQSITVYQSDGTTAYDLSGKTLAVIFETFSGVDVAVVSSGNITISGDNSNIVTFAYPSAVTATERTLKVAIRDAAAPLTVYLQGVCSVINAPSVDA